MVFANIFLFLFFCFLLVRGVLRMSGALLWILRWCLWVLGFWLLLCESPRSPLHGIFVLFWAFEPADDVLICFNFSYLWLIPPCALFHFLFFFSISYTFAAFWVQRNIFGLCRFWKECIVVLYWTWIECFLMGEDVYVFFSLLSKRIKVPHCRYIKATDSLHLLAYLCVIIKASAFSKTLVCGCCII